MPHNRCPEPWANAEEYGDFAGFDDTFFQLPLVRQAAALPAYDFDHIHAPAAAPSSQDTRSGRAAQSHTDQAYPPEQTFSDAFGGYGYDQLFSTVPQHQQQDYPEPSTDSSRSAFGYVQGPPTSHSVLVQFQQARSSAVHTSAFAPYPQLSGTQQYGQPLARQYAPAVQHSLPFDYHRLAPSHHSTPPAPVSSSAPTPADYTPRAHAATTETYQSPAVGPEFATQTSVVGNGSTPSPKRPSGIDTNKYLGKSHITGDYDSLLFRHPRIVESWLEEPYSYTPKQVTAILEYFVQVAQIKDQARVDQILQKRTPEVISSRQWQHLDRLDPLVRCPSVPGQPAGVPQKGSILGGPPGQPTTEPTESHRPSGDSGQLPCFPKHWECLPIGTTCGDILRQFPNHASYEFLDAFFQHKVHPVEIMDKIAEYTNIKTIVESHKKVPGNMLKKRMDKRMEVLVAKADYDYDRVDLYLKSAIKIRRLGFEPEKTDMTTCEVDHSRRKIESAWLKWWNTDDGKSELQRLGLDLNDPPLRPHNFGRHSSARISSAPLSSLNSPTPRKPAKKLGRPPRVKPHDIDPASRSALINVGECDYSMTLGDPGPLTAGTARQPPRQPSAAAVSSSNGDIQVSASVTLDNLGQYHGLPLWSSKHAYVKHTRAVFNLNSECKKLLTWIAEHDDGSRELGAEALRQKVDQALCYVIDASTASVYQTVGRKLAVPQSGVLTVDVINAQLEAEMFLIIQKDQVAGLKSLTSAVVNDVRQAAQHRQLCIHKTIVQSLATVAESLLCGNRNGVFDAATDVLRFDEAASLVRTTEEAIEAQCFDVATIKQRFLYADELKNAISWALLQLVDQNLDGTAGQGKAAKQDYQAVSLDRSQDPWSFEEPQTDIVNKEDQLPKTTTKKGKQSARAKVADMEFLEVMAKVTRDRKATMADTQNYVFPENPLDAALSRTAFLHFDDILEQIEFEMEALKKPKVRSEPDSEPAPAVQIAQPSSNFAPATRVLMPETSVPEPQPPLFPVASKKRARDDVSDTDADNRLAKKFTFDPTLTIVPVPLPAAQQADSQVHRKWAENYEVQLARIAAKTEREKAERLRRAAALDEAIKHVQSGQTSPIAVPELPSSSTGAEARQNAAIAADIEKVTNDLSDPLSSVLMIPEHVGEGFYDLSNMQRHKPLKRQQEQGDVTGGAQPTTRSPEHDYFADLVDADNVNDFDFSNFDQKYAFDNVGLSEYVATMMDQPPPKKRRVDKDLGEQHQLDLPSDYLLPELGTEAVNMETLHPEGLALEEDEVGGLESEESEPEELNPRDLPSDNFASLYQQSPAANVNVNLHADEDPEFGLEINIGTNKMSGAELSELLATISSDHDLDFGDFAGGATEAEAGHNYEEPVPLDNWQSNQHEF